MHFPSLTANPGASFSRADAPRSGVIMQPVTRNSDHPVRKLVALFVCWKTILLLVALLSPGPGYDTSGSLPESGSGEEVPGFLHYVISKLIRWDAIYFVRTAQRGYVFEQEWAFGWGFSRLINFCTGGKKCPLPRFACKNTEKHSFKECGTSPF